MGTELKRKFYIQCDMYKNRMCQAVFASVTMLKRWRCEKCVRDYGALEDE